LDPRTTGRRVCGLSLDTASQSDPIAAAYRHPADDVVRALETDARRGLSAAEAGARLSHYGRNELASEKPIPAWKKFLAQFKDMLVILLLVATAISAGLWLYERESVLPYEALAISAIAWAVMSFR